MTTAVIGRMKIQTLAGCCGSVFGVLSFQTDRSLSAVPIDTNIFIHIPGCSMVVKEKVTFSSANS